MSTAISPNPSQFPELDVLPPRVVHAALGLDAVTVWRMRRRGEFPHPLQLSPGRVGYRRADIEQWLASRQSR